MDISRETFVLMDVNTKLNVLFDFAVDAHSTAVVAHKIAEELDKAMHRKSKFDSMTAAAMGFVGGFVGFCSQKLFFK